MHPRERVEAAPAVELPDRNQVEQVDPRADACDRGPVRLACHQEHSQRDQGGAESPHWSGQAHACVFMRRRRVSFHAHHCANERNEHGRGGGDAEAGELEHMSHFVDINRNHKSQCEFPAVQRPIDAHESQHGKQGLDFRQSEEQEFSLGEQAEQTGGSGDTCAFPGPARTGARTGGRQSGGDLRGDGRDGLTNGRVLNRV